MFSRHVRYGLGWSVLLLVGSLPVLAQQANFAPLHLAREGEQISGQVTGSTGGAFSLANIAPRDRHGNPCLGFGSPTPDHLMILEENLDRLTLTVHSGGKDTTLVIQGPNNTIRCGDDGGSGEDASVQDTNWEAGTYQVWVGSFEASQRWRYRLVASE